MIFFGTFVGLLSSFFGVGGGIIIVPGLYFLFPEIDPNIVISTSLGVIFINSMRVTYLYKKEKMIPAGDELVSIGLGSMLGVILGTYFLSFLSADMIKKVFAGFLMLIIAKNVFMRQKKKYEKQGKIEGRKGLRLFFIPFGGGIMSGVTGLGGGALMIPLFWQFLKVPFKKLPGFSNVAMFFIAIMGIIPHMLANRPPLNGNLHQFADFQVGHLNWAVVFFLVLGSFLTTKWGVRLNQKVPEKVNKWSFIFLLAVVSIKILFF